MTEGIIYFLRRSAVCVFVCLSVCSLVFYQHIKCWTSFLFWHGRLSVEFVGQLHFVIMSVHNRAQFAWRTNEVASLSLGFDKIRSLLILVSKQTSPSAEVYTVISMNISYSSAMSLYVHLVLSEEENTNTRSNTLRELLSFKPSSLKFENLERRMRHRPQNCTATLARPAQVCAMSCIHVCVLCCFCRGIRFTQALAWLQACVEN